MGELINGIWHRKAVDTRPTGGVLKRAPAVFRNWITPDGAAGPSGEGGFAAEAGRYHLYASYACPWAHRTLIMRSLKGMHEIVGLSLVNPFMSDDGWTFDPADGVISDTLNHVSKLHELYTLASPGCTTRATVPILWDKLTGRIVSNESSEIIRMFGSAFDTVGASEGDYYPVTHRESIDALNVRVYETLNNGVYKAGFSLHQNDYESAISEIFATLDWLEDLLTGHRYLVDDELTEADIRLFVTLLRFDPVYVGLFKCNLRMISSYPNLKRFTRDLYWDPAIRPTVRLDHIKVHYYRSLTALNPSGVIPVGPRLDHEISDRDA
jgi:putative glutathione S-transferase